MVSAVVGDATTEEGVPVTQFLVAPFTVFGVAQASFTMVAVDTAVLRENGVLLRLRADPVPAGAVLAARIGASAIAAGSAVLLLTIVGVLAYDVQVVWNKVPALLITPALGIACCAGHLALATAETFSPGAGAGFSPGHLALLAVWTIAGVVVARRRLGCAPRGLNSGPAAAETTGGPARTKLSAPLERVAARSVPHRVRRRRDTRSEHGAVSLRRPDGLHDRGHGLCRHAGGLGRCSLGGRAQATPRRSSWSATSRCPTRSPRSRMSSRCGTCCRRCSPRPGRAPGSLGSTSLWWPRGRYSPSPFPRGLADLLVGIARWNLRVLAYVMLLSPRYPPFGLDQGATEPDDGPHDDLPPRAAHPARSAAGSVVALVAGVLLLAPAAGMTIGGGFLLAVDGRRDNSGYVTSPAVYLTSSTAAITAENLTITDADAWTRGIADIGGLRLRADSATGRAVFIGIAPQQSVDAWLSGTAHAQVTSLNEGTPSYDRAAGDVRAVTDPASRTFWLASATGPDATLEWNAVDGEYAVVVANADGSPGVAADVRGAFQVPTLTVWGGSSLAVGIALGVLAVGLIVLGGIGLGRRHSGPPPPVGPAPQPVPPVTAGV